MAGLVGQMLDHYKLVEQIGQGGMATVYRALDMKTMQDVALKVLSPTITGEKKFVKRFRREAEIVKQRLNHPNIAPVTAYSQSRGYIYLVMPFIQGQTLYDHMVKTGLTDEEALLWIGQVTDALAYAHKKGVIHRDVKPSNIMITPAGKAVLMDFGLARMAEGTSTLTGSMLMGTPAYVSPEQGKGEKLDHRTDQYSLGVILYQIATSRLPFDSDSPMALVLMHLQELVPRPSRFNKGLKPGVERVILKALAKHPDQRFKSMKELGKAYQAAVKGDPVTWVKEPIEELPHRRTADQVRGLSGVPQRRVPGWLVPLITLPLVAAAVILAIGPDRIFAQSEVEPVRPVEGLAIAGTEEVTPSVIPPTATTAPSTATPASSASCPGLRLIGFSRVGGEVSWTLDNGTTTRLELVDIQPRFPLDNELEQIYFGGEVLIDLTQTEEGEAVEIPASDHTSIDPGELRQFKLAFTWADSQPGYALDLVFNNNCLLQTEW
jgi:serine/threonine-protein kinase